MDPFLEAALSEAQKGEEEGGIPIGSVLVIEGRIVGAASRGLWRFSENRSSIEFHLIHFMPPRDQVRVA